MKWSASAELLVKELILFSQVPNLSQSYLRHWEHLAQHVHISQVQIKDWEWGQERAFMWGNRMDSLRGRGINIASDFNKDETPYIINYSSFNVLKALSHYARSLLNILHVWTNLGWSCIKQVGH